MDDLTLWTRVMFSPGRLLLTLFSSRASLDEGIIPNSVCRHSQQCYQAQHNVSIRTTSCVLGEE
jgi:hypothetical protein